MSNRRIPTIEETIAYANREWGNTLRALDGDPRVDWTTTVRPVVLGGACARCLHQDPLHEPGCVTLECRRPLSCGCRACLIVPA